MPNGLNNEMLPFNGNFYDSDGNIRNIDSLSGGGGSGGVAKSYVDTQDQKILADAKTYVDDAIAQAIIDSWGRLY